MLSRRNFFFGLATLPFAAGMARAESHSGHGDGLHGGAMVSNKSLMDSLALCVSSGEICNAHCLKLMASGDTTLGDCQKLVLEMLAASEALMRFVAVQSSEVSALKPITERVLKACKKECLKHKKHQACLDCANGCDKALTELASL